jgi:hypothetical protein
MKIIAVGKNYSEHALEFDGTSEKPAVPMIFMKPDSAIIKNGKHFYVYSLRDFELIKRVTLPRTYESINVRGYYSDDGRILFIPAERYVYDDPDTYQGHYEYVLCQYETTHYTLVKKMGMPEKMYLWRDIKTWLIEKGF